MKRKMTLLETLGGLLMITLLATLVGCTPGNQAGDVTETSPGAPDTTQLLRADLDREETAGIETEEVNGLVEGNNRFAFDLYPVVAEGNDNLIYSPYSISQALSLVYAGAQGETAEQMAQVLHTLPQDTHHPAFNALDQHLATLDEAGSGGESGNDAKTFRLNIANSLWAQQDYPVRETYLELLARHYGAGLQVVDFVAEQEAAKAALNRWVEEATEGRIKKLAPPLALTPNTRLVLANAIYFKASWLHAFREEETEEGEFTLLDGSTVTVPLMHGQPRAPYWEGEDFQAVQLPYWGGATEMLVILPAAGEWPAVENRLNAAFIAETRQNATEHDITLTMPRFSFDSTLQLKKALQEMGLAIPFNGEANFGGMVEGGGLFIGDAVHKGTITVDEEGTEAAAVTGVAMEESAYPTAEITLNRPFLFAIVERETGAILFLGRVLNPAA